MCVIFKPLEGVELLPLLGTPGPIGAWSVVRSGMFGRGANGFERADELTVWDGGECSTVTSKTPLKSIRSALRSDCVPLNATVENRGKKIALGLVSGRPVFAFTRAPSRMIISES